MDPDEAAEPRNYRSRAVTEVAIYAWSSVLILYALACGWVVFSTSSGVLSRTEAVFGIIALGLIAPVCSFAMRQAVRLQATQSVRQEPGIFSLITWRPSPRVREWALAAWRGGEEGARAPLSQRRAVDVGMAVASLALFWALWAGSLVAAAVVPLTIHWMRRRRPEG